MVRFCAVKDVDVVLDTMGIDTQEGSRHVLKRSGILVSLVSPPSPEKAKARGARGVFLRSQPRGDQLAQIAELVAGGRVKVNVEKEIPLHEARQVSQSGHAHGKIVLVMG